MIAQMRTLECVESKEVQSSVRPGVDLHTFGVVMRRA